MFLITTLGNRVKRRKRVLVVCGSAALLLSTLFTVLYKPKPQSLANSTSSPSIDVTSGVGFIASTWDPVANVKCSQPLPQNGPNKTGGLTVYKWLDLCGTAIQSLRQSPLYPSFPTVISQTWHFVSTKNDGTQYAKKIFGFISPPLSGRYKFAISSDDSSELWLSLNQDPADAKLLASVYSSSSSAWTVPGILNKYPSQISREISLEGSKLYFIEALHKQGGGDCHVEVYWKMPTSSCFEIVRGEFLSPFRARPHSTRGDEFLNNVSNYRGETQVEKAFLENSAVEFANEHDMDIVLPACNYRPSFIVQEPLKRYQGVRLIHPASVYPEDQTALKSEKTENWARGNPLVHQGKARLVAEKFVEALEKRWPGRYVLHSIVGMQQTSDEMKGDRFLIELQLGLRAHTNATNALVRLSKYVFLKRGGHELCSPKGYEMHRTAKIYFILPVKNQGGWLHHFLREMTRLYKATQDENFFVNLIDFESDDVDVAGMIKASAIGQKITLISKSGPFHKTLAIQEAASRVPSPDDIVFLFDLHIDIPLNLLDNIRKYTVREKMAYSPVVGRLDCGSSRDDPDGFWQLNGFGVTAVYKSDWDRFRGMNVRDFTTSWGGEDWDLVDRILGAQLEILQLKQHGLLHHYHSRKKMWNQ